MIRSLAGTCLGLLLCAGCEDGGDGVEAESESESESESEAEREGEGESESEAVAECVSDVPCSSDLQCVSRAGYACNRALAPPACQLLGCGESEACDRDEFCAGGRVCRVIDHAEGAHCSPGAVTEDDCLTSCTTAPAAESCPEPGTLCANVCSDLDALCQDEGGFRFVEEIYSCEYTPIHSADVILRCGDGSGTAGETHTFSF